MTIDDMRYILKIAEFGSITKASQALFITQPTLSQRLSKVETELNLHIFDRSRFGQVTLTEVGEKFCGECTAILSRWGRLQEDLHKLQEQKNIKIGIPLRTGFSMVEGLLDALSDKGDKISLTYVDCSNFQMEEMIALGQIDLAIIRMPSQSLMCRKRLLADYYPAIYLRKNSPLWDKLYYHKGEEVPYIDLALLGQEPLVAAPSAKEHRIRLWLDTLFAQVPNLHPRVIHTVPNISMYNHYVNKGMASYILPRRDFSGASCRLEPEYNFTYSTYLVQSDTVDPKIADLIFDTIRSLKNL